jgi:hypothetical protein
MSKSIAELRASGHVRRRTRDHTICLSVDLADEYRRLREELFDATAALEDLANQPKPPGRLGSKTSAPEKAARQKVDDLAAQLDQVAEQMGDFEVVVTLEQAQPVKWNEWAAEHPPREQAPDDMGRRALIVRDAQHGGRCDFDALVEALPAWITALNGRPATGDEWAWVADQAGPRELDDLADVVLELHTGRVSVPKPLRPSLATLLDEFASKPPAPGE